jgi:hypothetical protein
MICLPPADFRPPDSLPAAQCPPERKRRDREREREREREKEREER